MRPISTAVALLLYVASGCDQPPPPSAETPTHGPQTPTTSRESPPATASTKPRLPREGQPVAPTTPPHTAATTDHSQTRILQVDQALDGAAHWLASFPREKLRFDAAVMLSAISQADPKPQRFATALQYARTAAERDDDNPFLRLWQPDFPPPDDLWRWEPPRDGSRVNPNRPLTEALYCDHIPIRQATLDYILGPMRDDGQYHTTHAAWALIVARDLGCFPPQQAHELLLPIVAELAQFQPESPGPATLDVDLYAEQALMRYLAMDRQQAHIWVDNLVQRQNPDGSWAFPQDDEPIYYGYHATGICAWFLALWLQDQTRDPKHPPQPHGS